MIPKRSKAACPICSQSIEIQFGCDPDTLDPAMLSMFVSLAKSIVCRRCEGALKLKRDSEDILLKHCGTLLVLRSSLLSPEEKNTLEQEVRTFLIEHSRGLAAALRQLCRSKEDLWDPEVPELLFEDPSHGYAILQDYARFHPFGSAARH
jgi:hypothetical protein